jgi:hypothetical protein
MGVKISALPQNALPYSGSEEFPLVQGFETRAGTLSSLVNYLSGDFAFYNRNNKFTASQSIDGDLTVTGVISATIFNAVSANFSVIDIKQYELSGFSITGDLSATGSAIFQGSLSALGGGTFSGPSVVDVSTTQDALRVTQRGTGMALRVEDSSSTDSTPFVITTDGTVGVGTSTPNEKLTVVGNISGTGNLTISGIISSTGNGIFDTSSVLPALRVTQRGAGHALLVEDDSTPDSTPFIITSGGDVGVGTLTPNEKLTVVGDISATQVVFANELDFGSPERPSFTGIKQALNSFLYVAPALSYVRVNGSSSASLEVGQALTAPAITWTSNKVEAAAVSNYLLTLPTGITSTGSNTFTFSGFNDTNTYNITTLPGTDTQATSAWSVRVTDWANAQSTSSVTATWRYRVYYGATSQATPTDVQVRAGSEADTLATSRTGLGSRTVTPNNEYMFVAYPARFGTTAQFRVNGLPNTAFTLITINTFTNAYNGTAQYYVYRSDNLLTGTYTIEII